MVDMPGVEELLARLREELVEAERIQAQHWARIKFLRGSITNLEGLTGLKAPNGFSSAQPKLPIEAERSQEDVQPEAQSVALEAAITAELELEAEAESIVQGRPGIRDAILTIINESSHVWPLDDLMAEIDARGWLPVLKTPKETVRNSANRLADLNKLIARIPPSSYRRLPTRDEIQTAQWAAADAERTNGD